MENIKLDFAGVGSGKSGTTWLSQCLSEHPQVCVPFMKELNYFCSRHTLQNLQNEGYYFQRHSENGQKWLNACFNHAEKGQIKGEMSPTYLDDPESPRLLHEHNPDMKLIFTFRNPVITLFAFYNGINITLDNPISFEELLDKFPERIEYHKYFHHLNRYLEYFPREQMHFILFDDLTENPLSVYQELCRFLKVDDTFTPPSLEIRVNQRRRIRFRRIRNLMRSSRKYLNTNPIGKLLKVFLKPLQLGKLAALFHFKLNRQLGGVRYEMSEEIRHSLISEYSEDIDNLSAYLGRELKNWKQ